MNYKELLEHILFTKITDDMVMVKIDDIIPIIKKQIPMEVIDWIEINVEIYDLCPACECLIDDENKYCSNCGQRIVWK